MKNMDIYSEKVAEALAVLGENIKLARLRRRLSMGQMAERAGISRTTLSAMEQGVATVSLGSYMQALFVLGLENDIREVAKDDLLGRKIQDAGLSVKKRAPKKVKV